MMVAVGVNLANEDVDERQKLITKCNFCNIKTVKAAKK